MNAMHARLLIPNEQLLYVLSTFTFEPIRWLERFGWRKLTTAEKWAFFYYYRDLGLRMGITGIPPDMASFAAFNRDYEARNFAFAPSNARIGNKTLDLLLGFYLPRPLFGLARPGAYALMDPPLLAAMGFPAPPQWLRNVTVGGLKLKAALQRVLPRRRRPHLLTRTRRPSCPNGYAIADLGTFRPGTR